MKITLTVAAFTTMMGFASAFAPNNAGSNAATQLRAADVAPGKTPETPKQWPKVNGWVADPSKFCAGLPGSTSPMGQFDPLGACKNISIEEIKRYRESEVTHGRVAMLATLGYLVGENFHPLFGGVVFGPANSHLEQVQDVAPLFFVLLTVAIGTTELLRAVTGWQAAESMVDLTDEAFGAKLLDSYYPGDIGFDPLGLKPKTDEAFNVMATKELQNGRLAMFAAIGMLGQEQVTHEPILETLKTLF